jgi:hypothetical protein
MPPTDVTLTTMAPRHIRRRPRGRKAQAGPPGTGAAGCRLYAIDSISVLYGYGTRDELEQASPTRLAAAPTDIPQMVAGY